MTERKHCYVVNAINVFLHMYVDASVRTVPSAAAVATALRERGQSHSGLKQFLWQTVHNV